MRDSSSVFILARMTLLNLSSVLHVMAKTECDWHPIGQSLRKAGMLQGRHCKFMWSKQYR